MNIRVYFLAIMAAAATASADLTTVTIDNQSLHAPNTAMGMTYSGMIQYSLAPMAANDSVFVSVTIRPAAGGDNLTLSEVSGDVGSIFVNTNTPAVARTYTIFFQASNAVPGVSYIAHLTANANPSSAKTHYDNLINTLSKTQEATLMTPNGYMESNGAGSVPMIYMADGPHGVRGNGNATCFATCAGLCNTWDTAMAYLQGQAKGEEFRGLGRNCSLGPADDLVYHPQGGRASEYYGEDPYLCGRMQAADVRGLQSRGVIATIKHYACNNKEENRTTMSSVMDERSMREIYLYNWKPAIASNQGCWGIMNGYNRVSTPTASYCGTNRYLLSTVLREEWGYKFLVMTDWGAKFDNLGEGMNWGCDIQMPSGSVYTTSAISGYGDSLVSVHARRVIYAHEMLGDMAAGYNRTAYQSTVNSAAHAQTVRQIGAAGIVLAKNAGNLLPIPKTGKTIAITGPYKSTCRLGPGGSSQVTPPTSAQIDPTEGINNLLAGAGSGASTITTNLNSADYILVFVGVTGEREGSDRPSLGVDGESDVQAALNATNGANKTVVIFTGGSAASAGTWSSAPAILIAFYPGQQQGNSIADVLFGDVNPSGKLAVTFPANASQLPNFSLSGGNLKYPRSDTAHGYFRACKRGETPLFWFGHGLSYTTFSYSNLQVYPASIKAGDRVRVRVTVTNTGSVAGKEVVQLYCSMPNTNPSLPVRVQDLRGFTKVSLNAGASTTVDFELAREEMQVYNPGGTDYANNGHNGVWTVLSGTYNVRVGTSADRSATPSMSGSFTVQ
ncbi:MAG: glycoside hydrolase family 3 C-terminal domain-containing protein [Chitinispirillaceae bacterium]|nr:glycoside hydrolase family 3 C-terminal domain-containing protein [Chitinispirillaceae bacterium]